MRKVLVLVAGILAGTAQAASAQMTFFVASEAPPPVAGVDGIEAADEHCEYLGYSAGLGDFEWRAFLDVAARDGKAAVPAVDRVGEGPWYNYNGALIAESIDDLKAGRHNLTKQTAVDERGYTPYSGASAPSPADLLKEAKPDAEGRFFCFAIP